MISFYNLSRFYNIVSICHIYCIFNGLIYDYKLHYSICILYIFIYIYMYICIYSLYSNINNVQCVHHMVQHMYIHILLDYYIIL